MKLLNYFFLFIVLFVGYIPFSFSNDTKQSEIQRLEQQADNGDAAAQLALGNRYMRKDGVAYSEEKAAEYYEKALSTAPLKLKIASSTPEVSTLMLLVF